MQSKSSQSRQRLYDAADINWTPAMKLYDQTHDRTLELMLLHRWLQPGVSLQQAFVRWQLYLELILAAEVLFGQHVVETHLLTGERNSDLKIKSANKFMRNRDDVIMIQQLSLTNNSHIVGKCENDMFLTAL